MNNSADRLKRRMDGSQASILDSLSSERSHLLLESGFYACSGYFSLSKPDMLPCSGENSPYLSSCTHLKFDSLSPGPDEALEMLPES